MVTLLIAALQVTGIVALAAPAGAAPAAAGASASCRVGAPVVNVAWIGRNFADVGVDGHVWALDDFLENLRIWRTGDQRFCAEFLLLGRFTTFAGLSPEGTGVVRGGITGVVTARKQLGLAGVLGSSMQTHGFIGTFDGRCQADGQCLGDSTPLAVDFLSRTDSVTDQGFLAVYHAGRSTWIQTPQGDTGDITTGSAPRPAA